MGTGDGRVAGGRARPARVALGNELLVRLIVATLMSTIAEWALFVGALVYAFERGGSRVVGLASVALLIPVVIAAPLAGSMADRRRPNRVRQAAYSVQVVAFASAAAFAFASAPVVVVIGCCAVAVGAVTFIRPANAVLLPAMVRSTQELTAANVLLGSCESFSMLGGPLLAAALLAVRGPALVLCGCAVLTSISVIATMSTASLDVPPVSRTDSAERTGSIRLVVRGIGDLRGRRGATGVLVVAAGQYLLVGSLDLIFVVLAKDVLDLGESGPGLLAACFGAGAMVYAVSSSMLVKRSRLAPTIACALVVVATGLFILGVTPTLVVVVALLPVVGFGRSLLDLMSRLLLQRSSPPGALAAVFASIELFAGIGMALGSIVTQTLIAVGGVRSALVCLGAFFAVLLILTWRSLRVADDSADVPIVSMSLLRRVPAFAPLPPLQLESVARSATEVQVAANEVVVAEGEPGDRFYSVVDGSFDVSIGGEFIRTLKRGAGFGDVALLANVARTATVTARTPGQLLAVDRLPFLIAVTGCDSSRQAAWGVIRTLNFDAQRGDSAEIRRVAELDGQWGW